jgi:hypothetical protein
MQSEESLNKKHTEEVKSIKVHQEKELQKAKEDSIKQVDALKVEL